MIPEIPRWTIGGKAHERNARVEKRSRSADGAQGCGKEAKLSYSGNLLVENRNGLIVGSRVWEATGTAERDAALEMLRGHFGKQARDSGWRQRL